MRTLKLSMAIVALALSSMVCQAQPGGGGQGRQAHRGGQQDRAHSQGNDKGAKLAKELGLSTKQANRLKVIHEKQQTENKAIQEQMAPLKNKMKALKEKKKALNEINMVEIKALLTPEQFRKFNELKDKRKENRKEKKK